MKSSQYPAQDLRRRALAWAIKLKVNPRVVRVQDMRRKWGSCSSAGTVTLAIDLLDQDERFQDYVIVHELLHLRYPSHGRMFKALMGVYVPEWREFDVTRRADTQLQLLPVPAEASSKLPRQRYRENVEGPKGRARQPGAANVKS